MISRDESHFLLIRDRAGTLRHTIRLGYRTLSGVEYGLLEVMVVERGFYLSIIQEEIEENYSFAELKRMVQEVLERLQ